MLNQLSRFLPLLACGGVMYVCMRMMGGHGKHGSSDEPGTDVSELKAELAGLRAELEEAKHAERLDG